MNTTGSMLDIKRLSTHSILQKLRLSAACEKREQHSNEHCYAKFRHYQTLQLQAGQVTGLRIKHSSINPRMDSSCELIHSAHSITLFVTATALISRVKTFFKAQDLDSIWFIGGFWEEHC